MSQQHWTPDELARIGAEDELRIKSERPDGTLGSDRIIWVVRVEDALYVRSAHGTDAVWWQGTQRTHRGRIRCAGIERDVTFADVDADIATDLNHAIDEAYRAKYRRYPQEYVTPVTDETSRAITIRLVPR